MKKNKKQFAYPSDSNLENKGFTKEEIVAKDILCAIISGTYSSVEILSSMAKIKEDPATHLVGQAMEFTNEFFKQINDLKNEKQNM